MKVIAGYIYEKEIRLASFLRMNLSPKEKTNNNQRRGFNAIFKYTLGIRLIFVL
jgi:hypothetical protein|tara:strand:+ start:517 stop:678 length:162 start_codon:yes stop_codon:yes gene_type:complete